MNDTAQPSANAAPGTGTPTRRLRFVTAASLFDGHDAAIHIMRRILQAQGAEVIHLGHDRAVEEVVQAAIQEDAHGIAVSSYQGGHVEYFTYLVERLAALGRPDILVFGGGGGTITDREIALLHSRGVARIYSVDDGRRMGLVGMIQDMMVRADRDLVALADPLLKNWEAGAPLTRDPVAVGQLLTAVEALHEDDPADVGRDARRATLKTRLVGKAPVIGITGTGGAGKSSLTDELVRRTLQAWPDCTLAVLSVDPTRRRTGGALLGDRIRMNAVFDPRVYMRSMATRAANQSVSRAVGDAVGVLRTAGFDLVILETAGIGQSGTEITELADVSLYVMTPEYGAPSQLEKIDMLDYADVVAINKADKRGAEDAWTYVAKQVRRNRNTFDRALEDQPVYLCSASRFGDAGVDRVFAALMQVVGERVAPRFASPPVPQRGAELGGVLPAARVRYLSDISDALRNWHKQGNTQQELVFRLDGLRRTLAELGDAAPEDLQPFGPAACTQGPQETRLLRQRHDALLGEVQPAALQLLRGHDALMASLTAPQNVYEVRGREFRVDNYLTTLSGTQIPKVATPRMRDLGERLRYRWFENVPGEFPYTAGVFPYKRQGEDPTRMFAGEGTPERTNRRFHFLSKGQPAARLSTAFDSVTLYGNDPALRPDVWGKVGNSGVNVATLDDAKRLYSGFDLLAPTTSVSMTINGPAPMILAMFLNTAIDQAIEARLRETGRWEQAQARIRELAPQPPTYRGDLPTGHNQHGLGLLGVSGRHLVDENEYAEIRATVLRTVRGTVQADILKEDQAQNTCIFSTEFALKMMGDMQEYFCAHEVQNFYSVSISGYHIAEAGANPITQLAFTLANGFTFVEYYRARGMDVDAFARNLSFFFSNGIDAEYAVIGRVARRIWAVAMRDVYKAGARSQQLKYHIQTSGRSLHAQEIDFNDIRTTLQALYAIADNCNSLHTNAYDEAITTPTEDSVRRALAIQLIINRELGLTKNENPMQGAYFLDVLTDLVEAAVLAEFDRLTERGGVLGAMEWMYQRGRIQEESMQYEHKKHSGELPIIGVNTFLNPHAQEGVVETELVRSSDEEKQSQIDDLAAFHARHAATSAAALSRLQDVATAGGNLFAELMETVQTCSLGQISRALFEVGGQYRRNM